MKKLQEILNANGGQLTVDGAFGPKSLTALHQYVKSNIEKREWVMPKNGFVWIRTDKIFLLGT